MHRLLWLLHSDFRPFLSHTSTHVGHCLGRKVIACMRNSKQLYFPPPLSTLPWRRCEETSRPFDGVTAVSAGAMHSVAIQDGNVYLWGSNEGEGLGVGLPARLLGNDWVTRGLARCGACPGES